MSASVAAKKDFTWLFVFIYLAIVALFFFVIPPIAPITEAGMRLLGVFIAAIFGWSIAQSEIWPSLLTFILLPFVGLTNLPGILGLTWGTDTFLIIIFMMILVGFLESSGATVYVASFLMSRKFLLGHPWRLIFMIFLIAWILSSFCGNFPGMFITWSFIYSICKALGYKPYEKFSNLLIFGVGVMGALSLSALPWAGNSLVILNAYAASSGTPVNYAHYLAYSLPYGLFSILGFLLLCKFVFRMDVSKLKDFKPDFIAKEDLVLTPQRKIALIATGVLILMFVVPGILPAGNPVKTFLDSFGLTLKVIIIFFALSLIKVDGQKVFDFHQLASKNVPWNMVMMCVGILSFVGLLGKPEAGISAFLGQVLTPLFQNTSVVFFFAITVLVTLILTNFMINMVVAVIMIAAVVPISATLGVAPLQIVYLITIVCTIAFMLPAASAASCVLFANTAWIKAKDIYLYSVPTIIMLALVAVIWNVILFMF